MMVHTRAWASRGVAAVITVLGLIALAVALIVTTGPRAGAAVKAAGPPHPPGVGRHLGTSSGWLHGNGGHHHARWAPPRHVTAPAHKADTSLPRTARSDPAAMPGSAGTSAPAAGVQDTTPAAATAPPAAADTTAPAGTASEPKLSEPKLRTTDASGSQLAVTDASRSQLRAADRVSEPRLDQARAAWLAR